MYRDFKFRGIDVGKDTLYAVMGHFEDASLFFSVPAFRSSLRARRTSPKKVYAADPGLAHVRSDVLAQAPGRRLETVVYLELRRRTRDRREGYDRREGHISYYRTESGREVDFALSDPEEHRVTAFFLVCADMQDPKTRQRELRALEEVMGETGVECATVITLRKSGVEETTHGLDLKEEVFEGGLTRNVPAF